MMKLANRIIQVVYGNTIINKILNNGLLQGSVQAPPLFSLYISDMPDRVRRVRIPQLPPTKKWKLPFSYKTL